MALDLKNTKQSNKLPELKLAFFRKKPRAIETSSNQDANKFRKYIKIVID